jgi:hypothetical protein
MIKSNQKPRLYISIDQSVLDDLKTIANALGEPVGRVAAHFVEQGVPTAMDSISVFNESVENHDTELVVATKLISNALGQLQSVIDNGLKNDTPK